MQTSPLKAHLCEPSSLHALTLLYTALLALLTYLHICSAFYFTTTLLFSLAFRHVLWDKILQPQIPKGPLYHAVFITCKTLSLSIPFMFSILMTISLIDFLVPLTGRSGSQLPPDLVVGVTVAMLMCLTCAQVVSLYCITFI